MLDSYANRHGYMFAFGVTVNSCFDVLFGNYVRVVGEKGSAKLNSLPIYFSGMLFIVIVFNSYFSIHFLTFMLYTFQF